MVSIARPTLASQHGGAGVGGSAIVAATVADSPPIPGAEDGDVLRAARDFARTLLAGRTLESGEEAWSHAEGVAEILADIGAGPGVQAAAYLVYAADALQRAEDTVAQAFGASYAGLVSLTRRLMQVQRAARIAAPEDDPQAAQQVERVRKMLLAFSQDLRVVLLRLASRLQTLRWHAASRTPCPRALALESRRVFAPLASRLGIWSVKWELEDLAFRFLEPEAYRRIARDLDETRSARELDVAFVRHQLIGVLRAAGIEAEVHGRPKHLYSIWRKMQGKRLDFSQVLDVRALRVVVLDVATCYQALSAVHARFRVVQGEYDDYIARPKPNGYQSLHTVVLADDGKPLEVQIRTQSMHEHAEHGVAAHWAYKEAGSRGYSGASAAPEAAERVAQARRAVMRQLLAWERDIADAPSAPSSGPAQAAPVVERLYVLTPQSTVVELPAGATPVDFAYALHTELGHRCRGARVDGHLVPLHTALRNGQVVEVVTAREGGPSLDWLNPELKFLASPRARAKVRAWFNAQAAQQTVARGREQVEKLLQREGRTAVKHDELAQRLGLPDAQALFEVVGKEELPLRHIEALLRPAPGSVAPPEEGVAISRSRAAGGGVLVVGVASLMTSLARCCRPAPPDPIGGFVTRGKGVAIHRVDCSNFRQMERVNPDRLIPVAWGGEHPATGLAAGGGEAAGLHRAGQGKPALYPVDVSIEADDRQGLLRDISEVLARERINVTAVNTRSLRGPDGDAARMVFTLEVGDTDRLRAVLQQVAQVRGVRSARRR